MATYNGQIQAAVAKAAGTMAAQSGVPRYAALPGSGVNPIPQYHLACFDTLGVRNYWTDTAVAMTNAPTPAGGATYVTSTLVKLGQA